MVNTTVTILIAATVKKFCGFSGLKHAESFHLFKKNVVSDFKPHTMPGNNIILISSTGVA